MNVQPAFPPAVANIVHDAGWRRERSAMIGVVREQTRAGISAGPRSIQRRIDDQRLERSDREHTEASNAGGISDAALGIVIVGPADVESGALDALATLAATGRALVV